MAQRRNYAVYIDDVVMLDSIREEHLENVKSLVQLLDEAGPIVNNLAKCEFV